MSTDKLDKAVDKLAQYLPKLSDDVVTNTQVILAGVDELKRLRAEGELLKKALKDIGYAWSTINSKNHEVSLILDQFVSKPKYWVDFLEKDDE